jgi:hypothetical protein
VIASQEVAAAEGEGSEMVNLKIGGETVVTYPHEIASKVQDDEQRARRSKTRQGFASIDA